MNCTTLKQVMKMNYLAAELRGIKLGISLKSWQAAGIKTHCVGFKKYLKISEDLIRSQGANLYVGKKFDTLVKNFNQIYDENSIFKVKNHMVAGWFYPNTVSVWKHDEYIHQLTTETEREEISLSLYNLAEK